MGGRVSPATLRTIRCARIPAIFRYYNTMATWRERDDQDGWRGRESTASLTLGPGFIGPLVKGLMVANVGAFALQYFLDPTLTRLFGLSPARFYADFPNLLHQPLTYMFLHGGFAHILFNMLTLWMFGTEFERIWSRGRFLSFYFLCGVSGAFLSLVFNSHSPIPIVGASGALYGFFAAYWLYFPDRILYIFFVVPVKVRYAIPGLFILGFLFAGEGVAHLAHLGGAVMGLALARGRAKARFSPFSAVQDWLRRRRHAKFVSRMDNNRRQADDVMRRVDTILDKIGQVGIENLSREEREFLEEASRKLSHDRRPGEHR